MAEYVCHFLDRAQHAAAEEARYALAKQRDKDESWKSANKASYGWASLSEVVKPCAMYYCEWLYDPQDPEHKIRRDKALAAIADGTFGKGEKNYYLSIHFWRDWSDKRPPICVLTPVGREWIVDSKASNGDGWKVTGEVPRITCHPSIQVVGWHGWLRDGKFVA